MAYSALDEQWSFVRSLLPEDLDGLAREHGAMRRRRGEVQDAETLLRLILLHVGGGLSLEQAVLRAREQGLASLTAVALFKRLRASERWLAALTAAVLRTMPSPRLQSLGGRYRLRALDATCIQEPGATGTDWRLHYSLKLPELVCDFFELTDLHGAEHLRRLPVQAGDVVLADRIYSRRPGVAAILRAGGEVVLRLLPSGFPLQKPTGAPFAVLPALTKALRKDGAIMDSPVQFTHEGEVFSLRFCAVRKSAAATAACPIRTRTQRRHRARSDARPRRLCLPLDQFAGHGAFRTARARTLSLPLADRAGFQAPQEPARGRPSTQKRPGQLSGLDASQGAHRPAHRQAPSRK